MCIRDSAGGGGALILVPEIALTPQLVGRFRSRFGPAVAVLHSGLKDAERLLHWRALRSGAVRLAVGVRSAVFAPVRDLALLVVDEEHDPSFKQDEKLRYQARDLAVVRAKLRGATVVLGSATPSLETVENARRGRYRHLRLPARVDDRPMPAVELVDLRHLPGPRPAPGERRPALSPPVVEALTEALGRGRQAILFLNRRGHSSALVCESCGQGVSCSQCAVALTVHLGARNLQCHYCGEARALTDTCPACGGVLIEVGSGTERVEAEVAARFPQARVARLDRDAATSAERLTDLLSRFARGEVDVLVGTQMVAKGHDVPGVTLVGVVLADLGLHFPDFRAGERTFQLLTQVAGRAGRGDDPGRVVIQTFLPAHYAVELARTHDYPRFYREEIARRRPHGWPPFRELVQVALSGPRASAVEAAAAALAGLAKTVPCGDVDGEKVEVLGPAPAPLSRIRDEFRWQLLLLGGHDGVRRVAGELARHARGPGFAGVSVRLDAGPLQML